MQLHVARLCLDCEEVHDARICPRCTSETFAFLSRWIPARERRARARSEEPDPSRTVIPSEEAAPSRGRWVRRGAVLAALGLGGLLWSQKTAKPASRTGSPAPGKRDVIQ
jgi:hypothetical protein